MRWLAPGGFELRANVARAERPPDFLELFGNQGNVIGNPSLRPERTGNADLGLAWSRAWERGRMLSLEVAHFESRAEDLVVYVHYSQSSVRAENVARATMRGEELSLRLAMARGIGVTGSFTHLVTRDEGPVPFWHGNQLPLRPPVQVFTRAEWAPGRLRLTASLEYIGANYLDRANLRPVPDRLPVGASIAFEPGGGLRLTLEGKNLGDDRIADVGGFPLPGRAVFASCELSLGPPAATTR
jgi:iron complex outermembrane receptor protein